MGVPTADANFAIELPDIINYAENRIYRDLDFLETRMSQTAAQSAGANTLSLSSLTYPIIVLETIRYLSALGRANPPLTRQSKPFMDAVYPTGSTTTSTSGPTDYCMLDQQTVMFGPSWTVPYAYTYDVYGTIRPPQLSATNTTTWLASNLPELYVAAAMVRASGYMKNYNAAGADDPQQPVSWESQYAKLLEGADVEEARRKAQSASWSDQKPLRTSTPQRA